MVTNPPKLRIFFIVMFKIVLLYIFLSFFQDLNSENQKTSSVEYLNCSEGENFANVKKKVKVNSVESPVNENISNSASFKDEGAVDSDSEPEEGEITDSQSEASYDEGGSSEDSRTAEETEDGGECQAVLRFRRTTSLVM